MIPTLPAQVFTVSARHPDHWPLKEGCGCLFDHVLDRCRHDSQMARAMTFAIQRRLGLPESHHPADIINGILRMNDAMTQSARADIWNACAKELNNEQAD